MAEENKVKNTNKNSNKKKNITTKNNTKKKTTKKNNVKKNNDEQLKRVDSYVEEIERTNNFKKIDIEEIEKQEEIERQTKLKEESNETVEESIEKEFKESKQEDIKDLNKTNGYDLKFDDDRLTELDSLDTSFLEGRINSKTKEKKAKKINDSLKKDNVIVKVERTIPFPLKASLLVLCIICGVILVAVASAYQLKSIKEDKKKEEQVQKTDTSKEINKDENVKKIVDENYLFVGDILTKEYDLKDSYENFPVVNSSNETLTTHELYNDLKKYIYIYNPSKVFIEIGTFDFTRDDSTVTIVKYMSSIIKEIKKNRPFAEIYIESIYPINDSDDEIIKSEEVDGRTNAVIENANNSIKEICEENDVTYVDLYSDLYSEEDEGLKLEYTTDGFHLSEEGYKVITTKIKRYLK
ncbi:MAG: hypothetical protein IKH54_00845 [Bacilli bacterium]|nr:hypothetical protein [Bacilli bacterium]